MLWAACIKMLAFAILLRLGRPSRGIASPAAVPRRTSGAFSVVGLLQAVQQPRVEAPVVLGCGVGCYARPRQLQRVQQPRLQIWLPSASSGASLALAQRDQEHYALAATLNTAVSDSAQKAALSAGTQKTLEPQPACCMYPSITYISRPFSHCHDAVRPSCPDFPAANFMASTLHLQPTWHAWYDVLRLGSHFTSMTFARVLSAARGLRAHLQHACCGACGQLSAKAHGAAISGREEDLQLVIEPKLQGHFRHQPEHVCPIASVKRLQRPCSLVP